MKDLSCTQELYLCVINKKGKIPVLIGTEVACCLIVSGIHELISHEYITFYEKNKLTVYKQWDDKIPYLKPLYEKIASYKKPKQGADVAADYAFSFSGKSLNQLIASIGESLAKENCADILEHKKNTRYIPKQEAITTVVEKVRAEFLENGNLTEETLLLAALLYRSGILKNYFSKFERARFKQRLKEIKESESYTPIKKALDEIENIIATFIIIMSMTARG